MARLPLSFTILVLLGCVVLPVEGVCSKFNLDQCLSQYTNVCNLGISSLTCPANAETCLTSLKPSCTANTYSVGYVERIKADIVYMCGTEGVAGLVEGLTCYNSKRTQFDAALATCKVNHPSCTPTTGWTSCLQAALKSLCPMTTYARSHTYIDKVADALNTYILFEQRGQDSVGSHANTLHFTTSMLDKLVLLLGSMILASIYN